MPDPNEPTHFYTLPTDDVGEDVAVLRVYESLIKATTPRAAGTTLQDFMRSEGVPKDDALSRGFGGYLLTQPGPKQDGYHTYYFAKPKTDAQKEVPFRSTPRTRDITWDNVLLDLHGGTVTRKEFEESGASGANSVSNARMLIEFQERYRLIPQITFPTAVLIEEFQSATPWDNLEATRPVPLTVRYFYRGAQLSINALHEDVTIPADTEGFEMDDEFGMEKARELPDGQFFPATVPTRWQLYTWSDDQEFKNGVYYRRRERIVKLPPLPRAMRF
jgi:hypothetical protein